MSYVAILAWVGYNPSLDSIRLGYLSCRLMFQDSGDSKVGSLFGSAVHAHMLRSAESSSAAKLFALDLVNWKPGKSEHKKTTPSAQCHRGWQFFSQLPHTPFQFWERKTHELPASQLLVSTDCCRCARKLIRHLVHHCTDIRMRNAKKCFFLRETGGWPAMRAWFAALRDHIGDTTPSQTSTFVNK